MNEFEGLSDQDILNLTTEEFVNNLMHEGFMFRIFEMNDVSELTRFIDELKMFQMIYCWYSTNLGIDEETKHVKDLSMDMFSNVWQNLGQYVQCNWKYVKFVKDNKKSERGNMLGWTRKISRNEKIEILFEIARRIKLIKSAVGVENFRVC